MIIERLATLNPPPMRRMPILVAGVGQTLTLPIVARHADSWHAFFPDSVEEVLPAVEALGRHCGAIGRDPHDIEWGVGLQPDDLDRFLAEDAERYVELGFTQFTLGFGGPGWRVEGGEAFLAWRDRLNARRLAETSDRAVSA
jgi:alkanesulfonate monooxygenase SsuD/methylene tetrahydromethanopterin reductase-like flavin-dependent oxidoreductase (luciferase family)